MPHRVKAKIGMDVGGLNEKGAAYILAEGICQSREEREGSSCSFRITDEMGNGISVCLEGGDRVRLERASLLTQEAVINDRNPEMVFTGSWHRMDDYCGNYKGTETLSREAGDTMSLVFKGSGIRLYGPQDMNYGMCDIYLDGYLAAEGVSQYPDKVDFPGMSRGCEKRYGQVLFETYRLKEGEHRLLVKITGRACNTSSGAAACMVQGCGRAGAVPGRGMGGRG